MWSGQRMPLTIQSMCLIMKSLPENSKFAVISYGSQFHFHKGAQRFTPYNDQSMIEAIRDIETFTANMGGNSEMGPVQVSSDLMRAESDGEMKNVFLLTDGGVGQKE